MNGKRVTLKRLILAAVLAPFGPACTVLVLSQNDLSALEAIIYYVVALIGTSVIGIPGYYLLTKYNQYTWWHVTITGFLAGIALGAFISFLSFPYENPALILLVCMGLTGLTAYLFWVVTEKIPGQ